jgi:hypothetical protein
VADADFVARDRQFDALDKCMLNGLPIVHAARRFSLFSALAAKNRVSVSFGTALYGTGVQPSRIGVAKKG